MTNYLKQPAFLLRAALVNWGHGQMPPTVPNQPMPPWPLFVGKEPAKPDQVITIFNTAGQLDARSMIDGMRFEHPGLQIRVRSSDDPQGEEKCSDLLDCLDKDLINYTFSINGDRYTIDSITRTTGAIPLGPPPGSNLMIYTINAVVAVSRS